MPQELPQDDSSARPDPLEERLVAYLDGELPPEEARQVEELLATDPRARRTLERLERTWRLLDDLDREEAGERFTQSTLEMVAAAAEDDVEQQHADVPRRRLRRWLAGGAAVVAAAAAAFLLAASLQLDPDARRNRQLLEDLPLLEDLDEYRQADDIEFLRLLYQHGLFVKEAGDDA
jgi:anti-sigma factor RsiW